MPLPETPIWSSQNLATHYQKRIQKDDACCRDVLAIQRPMTQGEYEACSYDAYEKAVVEYVGDTRGNGVCVNRIDKRGIRSIADRARRNMITCFHEHQDHPHEMGSSRLPMVEVISRVLRHLENQVDGKLAKLYAIKLVSENMKSKHRAKGATLPSKVAVLAAKVSQPE